MSGLILLMNDLDVGVTEMKSTDGNKFVGNESDLNPESQEPFNCF